MLLRLSIRREALKFKAMQLTTEFFAAVNHKKRFQHTLPCSYPTGAKSIGTVIEILLAYLPVLTTPSV